MCVCVCCGDELVGSSYGRISSIGTIDPALLDVAKHLGQVAMDPCLNLLLGIC